MVVFGLVIFRDIVEVEKYCVKIYNCKYVILGMYSWICCVNVVVRLNGRRKVCLMLDCGEIGGGGISWKLR